MTYPESIFYSTCIIALSLVLMALILKGPEIAVLVLKEGIAALKRFVDKGVPLIKKMFLP